MSFKYRARDASGKVVDGRTEHSSKDEVLRFMRAQELIPLSIEEVSDKKNARMAGGASVYIEPGKRNLWEKMKRIGTIPGRTMTMFFRQLSTMIRSGLTLTTSLDILEKQENNLIFKDILVDIKRRIDGGSPLSSSMRANKGFSTLMIALTQAGEESGTLDRSLERIASILEKNETIKKKVKGAMTYPIVILIFAVIITWVFIRYVLPNFEQVFKQLKIELPWLTRFMFDASTFIQEWGFVIFLGMVAVIAGIIMIGKTPKGREIIDKTKLKIPIFKGVIFRAIMARSTRTLSVMVQAGVPILNGLDMAGNVSDNFVTRKAWYSMMDAARRGQSLAAASANTKIFPMMVTQMIRVGEESGQLDGMLGKVADWYDEELDEQIKALTAMMEPMLIIVVGGLVSLIAMSIYGPITSAMQQMM